jgi:hypothetical protein
LLSLPDASAQSRPAIATLGIGNTNPQTSRSMVVWTDDRIGDADIWSQTVVECDLDGPNSLVNGRTPGRVDQRHSAIGATASGESVVVWEDSRTVATRSDIYGKRLAPDGTPLGPSFRINTDTGAAEQNQPDIARHPDGEFIVVWTDRRDNNQGDIFMQRFNAAAQPVGQNSMVNAAAPSAAHHSPAIAMRSDRAFAVAWVDARASSNGEIFLQWFAPDGNPTGANVRVDSDAKAALHRDPALTFLESGELVVTWADARDGDLDIWAQRYNSAGNAVGVNFRVNDVLSTNMQVLPAIDAAPGGIFMIAWVDYRKSVLGDIFAQRYDGSGTVGASFQVNEVDNVANPEPAEFPYGPSVAAVPTTVSTMADNTFVVAWTDFRQGAPDPNIFAQRYASDGATVGGNFRVDNAAAGTRQYFADAARDARSPNHLCFAWTDERNLATEGESIWADIVEWPTATQSGLRIRLDGPRVVISWPAELIGFQLESAPELSASAAWQAVPESLVLTTGDSHQVTMEIAGFATFFRFRRP